MDLGMDQKKIVVVAVRASKEIPKAALEWALSHVVEPGFCIKLLVVISSQSSGKRYWGFQRFTSDCASGQWRSHTGTLLDQEEDITDSCLQLMHQLCRVHKSCEINVKVKILSGSVVGVVAAEAKKEQTNWVILDKMLRNEAKCCVERLHCNVVIMKGTHPKVLRLNLTESQKVEAEVILSESFTNEEPQTDDKYYSGDSMRVPNVTPTSSPEHEMMSYTATDVGTSSISSSDAGRTSFSISEITEEQRKELHSVAHESDGLEGPYTDTECESMSSTTSYQPWIQESSSPGCVNSKSGVEGSLKNTDQILLHASKNLQKRFTVRGIPNDRFGMKSVSVREAISLSKKLPAGPPPLCSKCRHKSPVFGKPPLSFTYSELTVATNGFSSENFLAEGGFGSVYRGVLQGGQIVAVKQYKLASSQGDSEFFSEVEALSCAQHRNVVMLIGYCVEGGKRLLVYEYICNNSLDHHLYGRSNVSLEWSARRKIAIGAARGLRYLHEECRVGCIVHRDLRPNNILVTHDFEPLVGDFGLARCQQDGGVGEETRVIGTFGYLAPEYAQSGQITEKADVYSFGIVLLELVTGRKAVDINRPKGEQCLTVWVRRILKKEDIRTLIDPRLGNSFAEQELCCVLRCASLCIRKNPDSRPRMSQVLQMLEGGGI